MTPRGAGTGMGRMSFETAWATYCSECSTWSAQSRKSSTPKRTAATTPSAAARTARAVESGGCSRLGGGECSTLDRLSKREEPAQERDQDERRQRRQRHRRQQHLADHEAERIALAEQRVQDRV